MLWRLALGGRWRIERTPLMELLTAREGGAVREVIVAVIGKQQVGMICVEADPESREGYIVALAVLPLVQRRGIGKGLVQMALKIFQQYGVERVTLGQGSPRIWPGIPQVEHGAFSFFEKLGWNFGDVVYDMFVDLRSYNTPAAVETKANEAGVRYTTANRNLLDDVLAFQRRECPQWLASTRYVAELGDMNDILVALSPNDDVIGSLILYSQRSHPSRRDIIWQEEFGLDLTAISAISISGAIRGPVIRMGLVARATELLKWQGAAFCFVGWVPDPVFLEHLGYKVWHAYTMSSKPLSD